MRKVSYTDENGFNHLSLIGNNMSLSEAQKGILLDPPDLTRLDWDEIVRDLHNLLVARGLITMKDVNELQTLNNTILKIIAPRIGELYREKPDVEQIDYKQVSESNGTNNNINKEKN